MRAVAVVIVLLLAGCAAPSEQPQAERSAPLEPDCTHASLTAGILCAGTTSQPGDQWAEPFVAAHPRGSKFLLLAQGEADTPPAPSGPLDFLNPPPAPPCQSLMICLFLTTDGGQTWARSQASSPAGAIHVDPVAAWAGEALLVGGLITNGDGLRILRSLDDGQTFDEVAHFQQGADDRPWLTTEGNAAALVWQVSGQQRGFVSLSQDGGQTWSAPVEVPCNVWSRPVWNDGWIAACSSGSGTAIYDLQTQTVLAEFGDGGGTRTLARLGDGFVLGTGSSATLRFSGDALTWSQPFDLLPDAASGDTWIGWMTATGETAVAIVWDAQGGCKFCDQQNLQKFLVQADRHGVLQTDALQPTANWTMGAPGPRAFGEFDGIACVQVCLAAWAEEGRLVHVWLQE